MEERVARAREEFFPGLKTAKTSIFFQTTGRHPPGARRETTEVKTRKC